MNNLKRVLALSLAATSILSAAASASFTDTVDLASESAIDTLVGLGVIKGYEDGTFRPENTVTRAEMAKMIYTIKMGGNDSSDLFIDVDTNLSDISGHWAEGYIKYCESTGIIAGRGDGKFYPEATVTGTEAIKMALVVLGYDADVSELVGLNWSINTLALGSENGLVDGFVGSLASSAQRQSAATVLFNALYADMVRYTNIFESYEPTGYTLAEQAFNLETVESATITGSSTLSVTFNVPANSTVAFTSLNGNMDLSDYVGLTVDILYNTNTKNVLGIKPVTGSKVIFTTAEEISVSSTTTTVSGHTYQEATIDGVTVNLPTAEAANITTTLPNSEVRLVETGTDYNNTADVTLIEVAKTTYVSSSTVNVSKVSDAPLTTSTSIKISDNVVPADLAKGDYVTTSTNSYDGVTTLEIIDMQSGTVTATKTGYYRINGNWFALDTSFTSSTLSIDDSIEFYAVGNVIYAYETISSASTYALVMETDKYFSTYSAKLLFADGTTEIVTTNATADPLAGTLATFGVDSEGVYNLTVQAKGTGTTYKQEDNFINNGTANYYINDDTVVFAVHETNEYTVISGAELKALTGLSKDATVNYYDYETVGSYNYVTVAYVNFGTDSIESTLSSDNYGYVTNYFGTISDSSSTYIAATIWNGSENVKIAIDLAVSTNVQSVAKGNILEVKVTTKTVSDSEGNDYYVATSAVSATGSYQEAYYNANQTEFGISVGTDGIVTGTIYTITEDTVVFYVDSSDYVGYTTGDFTDADEVTTAGTVDNNVFFTSTTNTSTGDNEVTFIVVATNNKF